MDFKKFLIVNLGIIACAAVINIFWAFGFVAGGFPGFALILNYLTNFPVGLFIVLSNTVLILLGFFLLGKSVGLKMVYGYMSLSIFIELIRKVFDLHQSHISNFWLQMFLISFLGACLSFALSIVLNNSYSTGGYNSVAFIIRKYVDIPAPIIFTFLDFLLSIAVFFAFGPKMTFLLLINAFSAFLSFSYLFKLKI